MFPLVASHYSGRQNRAGTTGWYRQLKKPKLMLTSLQMRFTWIVMYCLMGVSSYRVAHKTIKFVGKSIFSLQFLRQMVKTNRALNMYLSQLLLGAVWMHLFFTRTWFKASYITQLAVWALSAETTRQFFKVDLPAGLMMSVYMAFLSVCVYVHTWILVKHRRIKIVKQNERILLDPQYAVEQESLH
ncbi:hypothetical protein MP228_003779 [Amoeboaphelidium protococcarum]|nr:hypothetical protein MP228_004993 [Amoeboaphelidium protococcarum]KAI3651357.1 hypothetical protein MP228_003779 [Amoeboaphelidium protococcarum]